MEVTEIPRVNRLPKDRDNKGSTWLLNRAALHYGSIHALFRDNATKLSNFNETDAFGLLPSPDIHFQQL